MGYLIKNDASFTMNKATVSVWFRVPSGSGATVAERDNLAPVLGRANLWSTVPLLMWGSQGTDVDAIPYGPSWIGVSYLDTPGYAVPGISFNLQTSNFASLSGLTDTVPARFGCIINESPVEAGNAASDAWHHLFMSWDIGSGNSASDEAWTSASFLNCVLDGVVKNGDFLPARNTGDTLVGGTGPENNMICAPVWFANGGIGQSATVSFTDIPVSPVVIPGKSIDRFDQSVGNLQVQIAHLQVFGGRFLNADLVGLFMQGGKPTNSVLAQSTLGVAPHIRFSKQSEWQNGNNTGSLGQFDVVGTVSAYDGIVGF